MQFNLFGWIREGVKRSVMLGVADAIEQVGAPPSSDDLKHSLNAFLGSIATPAAAGATLPAAGGRKRLGRSLRDFEGQPGE